MVKPGSAAATRRPNSLRCLWFRRPLFNRSNVDILRVAISLLLKCEFRPRLGSAGEETTHSPAGLGQAFFKAPARHQSMHRGSRSHAVKRAQGTNRTSTIACRPGPVTIKLGPGADSSFWFNTL